ncbi:MAG: cellulase family glycosylhydrolase [Anaerolineae bacterium]|nr:cellulase family glycosylhydrolase [Anaerolineae bacterium]
MKGRIYVLCLIVFLLLFMTLLTRVPDAGATDPAAVHPEIEILSLSAVASISDDSHILTSSRTITTSTYLSLLPIMLRNHRNLPPDSPDSPFSLQIAALHQVVPDEFGQTSRDRHAQDEWRALYEANFTRLVDALQESGASWSRVRINWAVIQPDAPLEGQPPVYVWGPDHDEKLALIADTGVHLIGTIDDVPGWAADEPYQLTCSPVRQDRLDEFAQFVTDLVTRYKEPPWNIHVWELRNEPDGTTPELADVGQGCGGFFGNKYTPMAQVAYPAIKAADPDATVLMGGVAYDAFTEYDGPFYRYFPDDVMATGGASYVDAINVHYFADYALEWERWVPAGNPPTCGDVEDGQGAPYEAGGIDVGAKIEHLRNRMATCFAVEKPVWVTELAEHGYPDRPSTLEQQARYVIQGHARALAAGAVNVTWFALVSPPYDLNEQGLLYCDFSPKPAFYAYQTLTSELAGYGYSHTLDAPGVEAYAFTDGGGRTKIVAWAWGEPLQPAYLTMPGADQVRRADRNGNVTYIADGGEGDVDGSVNGSILIELPVPPAVPPDTPGDWYRYTAEPLFLSQ